MPASIRSRKTNKRRRLAASADVRHPLAVNESSQHSRVGSSFGKSTDSPSHAILTTSVTNPLSGIPPGTVTSEMGNPSEVSGLCDTDRNTTSYAKDIVDYESSDELDLCGMNDGRLLSIINSESSVQVVSLLTALNSFIQKGLSSLTSTSVTQDGLDQALISACRQGHYQLVQTLVRVGANIEHRDEHGNTPLLICAENDLTDIIRFLVSRHANVSAVNSVGNTALILSIRSAGATDLTRLLLQQQDVDIHHENQHGHTAFHRAIDFMDVDTMRLLLYKSAFIDYGRRYSHGSGIQNETKPYFINSSSQMSKQRVIAAEAGLSGVYEILKEHVITGTSILELAIKASDITSLDMFLDCKFSNSSEKKRDIDIALMYMLPNSPYKERFSSTEMKIIQRLLQYGANINKRDKSTGFTLLSHAVESGDFQVVELMCTHSRHVTINYFPRERHPLIKAAKSGRQDLIELLLNYQAEITGGQFPDSPLDYALRNNHIECAKLLIQRGAKMDVQCALRSAIDHQVPGYTHFLYENYKPEIMDYFSQPTENVRELLIFAVKKGHFKTIGQILDAGVGVNEVDMYAQTPLQASKSGEVAEFLIQRGADVNQVTTYKYITGTPLIHVIYHRTCADASTVELCKVLIDNGASVNCRSGDGKTPLMMAASHDDSVDMLQLLLDNGADVNDKDNKGNTALMHAIKEYDSMNALCLIDSPRDKTSVINVHNNEGLTPLIVSAKKRNIPIMKALIEGGADVNMKDNQDNTALHHLLISHPRHNKEILACLLKAGSNVNCQNSDGLSPLMISARECAIFVNKKFISVSLITRQSMTFVMSSLLDAGADVNAVSKKDHSQTALSFILDTRPLEHDTILCIDTLLDRGASSSYLRHECLHRLIIQNQINIILKLIQRGAGPADVNVNKPYFRKVVLSPVSPLCVALLYDQTQLARYFVDILFLTSSDLSMLACNKAMERLLKQGRLKDSLHFLQELSSQPMSLAQLSLVAVSSAVGPSPGREARVNSLPLPQMMKDRLRFKSADDTHTDATLFSLLEDHPGISTYSDSDDDDDDSSDSSDDSYYVNFH